MENIKTIIGQHLQKLFPEGPARHIARFLKESKEEKKARLRFEEFLDDILCFKGSNKPGTRPNFKRFKKNLKFDDKGVYSYNIKVIELNFKCKIIKLLGRWSPTTTNHQNYALKAFVDDLGFTEIK